MQYLPDEGQNMVEGEDDNLVPLRIKESALMARAAAATTTAASVAARNLQSR